MVSTRHTPGKTPPASIPTCQRKLLSCQEQACVHAERAEWWSLAARANPPVDKDAHRASKEASTPPPLRTQPSPPSLSGLSPTKRCSPQLQRGRQDPEDDNNAGDIAVAAIFYGKGNADVNDVDLNAIGNFAGNDDINDEDYVNEGGGGEY